MFEEFCGDMPLVGGLNFPLAIRNKDTEDGKLGLWKPTPLAAARLDLNFCFPRFHRP